MQWITDREPSIDELGDHESTFVTIDRKRFGVCVKMATGFYLRSHWNRRVWGDLVVGWMMKPEPCLLEAKK